jgi:ABC-2 type transport system permease protein/lipopolysaccharide transport system permease protein
MRSFVRDIAMSIKRPEFWALSTWLDIVVRYRQSRLGALWLLAPPALYTWGLGIFFSKMQHADLRHFAAHVGIGYAIFRLMNSVITEAGGTFSGSASFILDGHLRLTDFVLRVVAKAIFYFAMALPSVIIALMVFDGLQWHGLAMSLLTFPLVIANAVWIAMVFALVGARFPDLSQLINNLFLFAFLFTPIIWYADAMPAGSVRGTFMRFNPLLHLIEMVRAPILGERIEPLTIYYIAAMTVLGWALAAFLYRRYARFVPLWI